MCLLRRCIKIWRRYSDAGMQTLFRHVSCGKNRSRKDAFSPSGGYGRRCRFQGQHSHWRNGVPCLSLHQLWRWTAYKWCRSRHLLCLLWTAGYCIWPHCHAQTPQIYHSFLRYQKRGSGQYPGKILKRRLYSQGSQIF